MKNKTKKIHSGFSSLFFFFACIVCCSSLSHLQKNSPKKGAKNVHKKKKKKKLKSTWQERTKSAFLGVNGGGTDGVVTLRKKEIRMKEAVGYDITVRR